MSLSAFKKEVRNIMRIADAANSELMLQQNPTYRKFKKSKKNGHKAEIQLLMSHLEFLQFFQESIFWVNRCFNERGCDKNERLEVFITSCFGYHGMKDYQKTMEFGQNFIDLDADKTLVDQSRILSCMVDASKHLENDEKTAKLLNMLLATNIRLRRNQGRVEKVNVLYNFYELIKHQMTKIIDCEFKKAIKTFDSLTYYKLNSMNSNDVIKSLEEEGFTSLLPSLLRNRNLVPDVQINDEPNLSLKSRAEKSKMLELLEVLDVVGDICLLKIKIFEKNGDRANQISWGHLIFSIKHDIQMHLSLLENNGFQSNKLKQESALNDCIFSAIALSQCDLERRTMLFKKLFTSLLKNRRLVSDCIAQAFGKKLYEEETLEIMPLLQFCIKHFDNFMHHINPNKTLEGEKLKMTQYRRSLQIMNHFQNADFR